MKLQLKKTLALLAAGALLTGTAAAYAAQLPAEAPASSPYASTSSDVALTCSVSLGDYNLTSNHFSGYFYLGISGTFNQSRATSYYVTIQREMGAGTSSYATIFEGEIQDSPTTLYVDKDITLEAGERLLIRVDTRAEAFYGYTYVGTAYGSDSFTFTL